MDYPMASDGLGFANELVRRYQQLTTLRGTWEAHWTEICERFLPGHVPAFSQRGMYYSQGEKRTQFIYDSHPVTSAERCTAIVESQITPRSQLWCRYEPESQKLKTDQKVLGYLSDMARIVADYMGDPESNFSSQNQQALRDLVLYGTGVLFIDQLDGAVGARFRAIHLGEIFFAQNHQGRINQAFRIFSMTAREAAAQAREAPKERQWKLPAIIEDAAMSRPEERFQFLHCVIPRGDRIPTRIDYKGMPYASYYVSIEGRCIIGESGYGEFPYAIARFDQAAGEIYGRSPAMAALPSVKMLNEMKKADIKQVHRMSDPVLLLADDDELDGFDLAPGSLNFGGVDEEGRPRVHTLPTGNREPAQELGSQEKQEIDDAFYLRLFQILTELPEMTATQSQYRELEKAQMLAPKIGRVQDEYCGMISRRVLEVLASQDVFDKPPQKLVAAGGRYRTRFSSPVSQVQRAGEATGIMQAATFLSGLAQTTGDPGYTDRLDSDEIGRQLPIIMGNEGRYVRSDDEVAAIQANRAKQQQEQAMQQAAPGTAALVSSAAKLQKSQAPGGAGGPQ